MYCELGMRSLIFKIYLVLSYILFFLVLMILIVQTRKKSREEREYWNILREIQCILQQEETCTSGSGLWIFIKILFTDFLESFLFRMKKVQGMREKVKHLLFQSWMRMRKQRILLKTTKKMVNILSNHPLLFSPSDLLYNNS